MKRKALSFIIAIITLMTAMPAHAQFDWGLRGGVNLNDIKLSDGGSMDKSNNCGFFVGPTVKFTVPVVGLSVDASALYNEKKLGEVEGTSIKARSIDIPLNIRYGIGFSSIINLFVFAGPQYEFNISSDKKLSDNVSEWTWKSSKLSVNVGVGCTVLSHLEVKANYNIACSDSDDIPDFSAKTNAWQLGLGYYF